MRSPVGKVYPHREVANGTAIYKLKKYADGDQLKLMPGDIIVGTDPDNNDTWILEKQKLR